MVVVVRMRYNKRMKAFHVLGTPWYFGPVPREDYDEVVEWLGRKLCDNPAAQAQLNVLGADSVEFRLDGAAKVRA